MLSTVSSRFSSAALVGALALAAGTAMAGNTYYVGSANGGVWKTTNGHAPGTQDNEFTFGGAGMRPIVGDWNGDGVDTAGVYDPATGVFFLRNSNSAGAPDEILTLNGGPAALPIAGDWDGDGVDTIGLYDPVTGNFFLRNTNSPGAPDIQFSFGAGGTGLVPISGDWNGDGVDTVGLYNSNTGAFFLRNTNAPNSGVFTLTFQGQTTGGLPVAGDWDGDGVTTVGIYVPATGAWFLRNSNTSGPADIEFRFSRGGLPVAGIMHIGCDSADFDCDGDIGTDADIEAFFACLAGSCPGTPCANDADFNNDGDMGTDADIESFFRVLAGGAC